MEHILTPTAKQDLISSLLHIIVGQTVDTSQVFLEAKSWRLEDVFDLFYVGAKEKTGDSSSYHVQDELYPATRTCSSSGLEVHYVPLPSASVTTAATSPQCVHRWKRRTRAEITADDVSGVQSAAPPELVSCRRRRTSMEMSRDVVRSALESDFNICFCYCTSI